MIVSAKRKNADTTVDVIIDPFTVLCEISRDWRFEIGVDRNSHIMGGYWVRDASQLGYGLYTRIRLATREEIIRFDAIKNVTELAATFYQ